MHVPLFTVINTVGPYPRVMLPKMDLSRLWGKFYW